MINRIPTYDEVLSEPKKFNKVSKIVRVTKNTHGPGAWYKDHIGEIFTIGEIYDRYSWRASVCLTKFIKPDEWSYVLHGGIREDDFVEVTEEQLKTQINREKKLRRILK